MLTHCPSQGIPIPTRIASRSLIRWNCAGYEQRTFNGSSRACRNLQKPLATSASRFKQCGERRVLGVTSLTIRSPELFCRSGKRRSGSSSRSQKSNASLRKPRALTRFSFGSRRKRRCGRVNCAGFALTHSTSNVESFASTRVYGMGGFKTRNRMPQFVKWRSQRNWWISSGSFSRLGVQTTCS
jgi:hypothetical protein